MGSFVLTAGHQRRRKRAHIPGCSGFTAGRLHKSSLLRASPFHLSMCRCMCGLCGCTHVCVHVEVRGQLQASLLRLCLPVCCCCLASGSLPSLGPTPCTKLSIHQVPGIQLYLLPWSPHTAFPSLSSQHWFWRRFSSLHACRTSPLPTELFHQPSSP